jgi:hypothetical protein
MMESRIIHPTRRSLKAKSSGPNVRPMSMQTIAHRVMTAILALAVLVATAPVLEAAASANPCDCPSMQMHQDMGHYAAPAKQKNAPCNPSQNCVCAVSCGMALSVTQQPFVVSHAVRFEKFAWPSSTDVPDLFIKPAIPPPIASV